MSKKKQNKKKKSNFREKLHKFFGNVMALLSVIIVLIVFGGAVFFLGLCATLGISLSTRDTTPIVAAEEQEYYSESQNIEEPPVWIRRYPHSGDE